MDALLDVLLGGGLGELGYGALLPHRLSHPPHWGALPPPPPPPFLPSALGSFVPCPKLVEG